MPGPTLPIAQSVSRIVRVSKLRDDADEYWDPTGWTLHAVARAQNYNGEVVGVWRSTPGTGEGLAEVVAADPTLDPSANPTEKWIHLHVDPWMSAAWTFTVAELWIQATEPFPGSRSESWPAVLTLVPTSVY